MEPSHRCKGYVSAHDAEERVWHAIEQVLRQPEIIAAEVNRQQTGTEEQRAEILQEISRIEDTLAKCDREEQRWAQAYVAEVINLEELKGYRSEIAMRRQQLVTRRHDLQTNLDNIGHALEQVEALMGYCERVHQRLQTFDPTEKRQAFEALNVRITWTPGQSLAIEGTIPLSEIVPVPLKPILHFGPRFAIERCGKIDSLNADSENCTGMGVISGFLAVALMM
jgi:chromosome segregation ATPase